MNSMIKIICSLCIAAIFGSAAFAELKPYCIRVYCDRDGSRKIKNAKGHGKYFSAKYDSKRGVYLLPKSDFDRLYTKSCGGTAPEVFPINSGGTPRELYGSDASMLESINLMYVVKWTSATEEFKPDSRCEAMEKK